jgi:hypothetical protein
MNDHFGGSEATHPFLLFREEASKTNSKELLLAAEQQNKQEH